MITVAQLRPLKRLLYPKTNTHFFPLSFTDYVTALQAVRKCKLAGDGKDQHFEITGIHNRGANWQVPFIKCDSRRCEFEGQDAQPFCEYNIMGVSGYNKTDYGGHLRALDFRDYVYRRYPVLLTNNGTSNKMPFEFEFVRIFDSQDAMDAYVISPDYGDASNPKLAMGIVWQNNSQTEYHYMLRQNSTNYNAPEAYTGKDLVRTTPRTDKLFDHKATHDFHTCNLADQPELGILGRSCTGQYMYNGVLAIQRLIGDYIHHATGAADAGYWVSDSGVQFVQFPTNRRQSKRILSDT